MIDYQNRVKVVDGVLLLKKVNTSTDSLITGNTPDSDEVMFYADQDGNLKIKNQTGDNEVGGGGGSSDLTEVTESTTSRTLSLSDVDCYIRLTNASACAITLPPQSSVTWVAGNTIYFRITNTGTPTITGSGVTINGVDTIPYFSQHSTFAIRRTNTNNVWDLV